MKIDEQGPMTDPERRLMQHEIECEARYGELRTRMGKIETETERNTRLLWLILTAMCMIIAGIFGPYLFG